MNTRFLLFSILVLAILSGCNKDNTTNPNTSNYESITIGTQIWMKKNLNVDHYRNGDPIPQVTDSSQWVNLTTGAWCYYNNDPANGAIYGKLYNWYAVNDPRGLAPTGWHIASDVEWATLSSYLGGDNLAGDELKEAGFVHWESFSYNGLATNSTGFTGLPGGYRSASTTEDFDEIGLFCVFWSSSNNSSNAALGRELWNDNSRFSEHLYLKTDGFSVRCIKD